MKLRHLPIAIGIVIAGFGGTIAIVSSSGLGSPGLGFVLACVSGGVGGHLGSRLLGRKVASRLAMPASEDPIPSASTGDSNPAGWPTLDASVSSLASELKRLELGHAELQELQSLARSLVAATGSGRGEFGELDARRCLQNLLAEFGEASALVVQAAEILDGAAERINSGSASQADAITRTTASFESLSNDIERIAQNAESVNEASEHARHEARRGLDHVHGAVEGMERLRTLVESNGRKIRRLGDRTIEIGAITEMITAISQRTDMLALNATIESVRAGENGRGFAIVAEEIRKLSERSATATKEINMLVAAIQGDTQDSIRSLAEQKSEVDLEVLRVREAGNAFEHIGDLVEKTAQLVEGISLSTADQFRATQHLVHDAQHVSEVILRSFDGASRARDQVRDLSLRCSRLRRLAVADPSVGGPEDAILSLDSVVNRPRLAALGRIS